MKHAIEALETKLETLRHNEPIHRAEGNVEQADLDAAIAADVVHALTTLRTASPQ
jgi:hypothetical protein